MPTGQCERCADTVVGYTDNGEALCEDCMFLDMMGTMNADERDTALLDEDFDDTF